MKSEDELNQDYDTAETKDDYSISESLKNLETLRSHLQVLGETSQSFSMIESLEKIFLQQAIQERNKQQKITDLISVTKLTLILVKSHVQSYLYS